MRDRSVRGGSDPAATEVPQGQSERILAQVSDLAISLLATAANPGYLDARQRVLIERVKGHIETRLRDPTRSPDEVAAAVNISTRYLHKLFEAEHETVALYLRGRRLQHARDDVIDPRLSSHSVATIAHRCGFGDISGLNRAFKVAFGINPRELRRADPTPTADGRAAHYDTRRELGPCPRIGVT